jgi:hypothetical protein
MNVEAEFAAGMLTTGYLVAALLFLKFWRRIGDGLFLTFAVAFALLAVEQAAAALLRVPEDGRASLYLIRLVAFLLIIGAVLRNGVRRRA